MERTSRTLAFAALAVVLTVRVAAQTAPEARLSGQRLSDEDEEKVALYKRFLEVSTTDESAAYDIAETYVQKYPKAFEVIGLKRFIANFRVVRKESVPTLISEGRFREAFRVGKEVLKVEPRDFGTLSNMVNAALGAALHHDPSLQDDAAPIAKLALILVESGEVTVAPQEPNDVLAWLNRSLGIFCLKSRPEDAAKYAYKALEYDAFKQDAYTYLLLAEALLWSEYQPLSIQYAGFKTRLDQASPKAALLRTKMRQSADHINDAAARFVKLAQTDPIVSEDDAAFGRKLLTDFYKYRNSGNTTGLDKFIEEIFTKPLGQSVPEN